MAAAAPTAPFTPKAPATAETKGPEVKIDFMPLKEWNAIDWIARAKIAYPRDTDPKQWENSAKWLRHRSQQMRYYTNPELSKALKLEEFAVRLAFAKELGWTVHPKADPYYKAHIVSPPLALQREIALMCSRKDYITDKAIDYWFWIDG